MSSIRFSRFPLLGAMVLTHTISAAVAAPTSSALSPAAMSAAPAATATIENALARAEANRPQLEAALKNVPTARREGMEFLIANMPDSDLRSLSSKFLLDHVALVYAAFEAAPWKNRVPRGLFLNDVLPYASLNETRDASFQILREKSLPLVAGSKTPIEAAQILNAKLFPLLNVRYSTERAKPDQSPLESIASGKASCSGLSIVLVDACRAVGIPARVVGTPLWMNLRGNHTWVEVWDGDWQFLGAAEPDPQGPNHGWFVSDAAQARRDVPQHAIYASSFAKTGHSYPLVWDKDLKWVSAVNVTGRYATGTAKLPSNKTRVLLKVLDVAGKRVAANVTVSDALTGDVFFRGVSKDESADLNHFLVAELPHHSRLRVVLNAVESSAQEFETGEKAEQVVVLGVQGPPPVWASLPRYSSPTGTPLETRAANQLKIALGRYFATSPTQQAGWKFEPGLEKLLQSHEPAVRQIAWQAYREAPIHAKAKTDYEANRVQFEKHLSPYTVKTVGTRPAKGWGLVIAMHGGGGTAKEVNDSQWAGMQKHYKDHPELGGYIYLALRAPNDTWNGFYDVYVYPLVANLIQQFTLWGDVDPNKVFLMGYSHGGYGAFAIGPKMPDRFAAIHASGAAPTDGETTAKTLRNTPFTAMVGEFDTMYGRLERDQKFDAEVRQLRGNRTDIYPVRVDVMQGFQHGNLKDHDKLVEMLPAVRNPVPRELTWLMTDEVIRDFFWLHTDAPAKAREIDATCRANTVSVTTTNVPSARVRLDSRLVDFSKPVQLEVNGQKSTVRLTPRLRTLCETLQERGDPELAFTAEIELPLPK
jgi:pimeloyl-ACP methyl ester carboxylesterase